MIKVKYGTLLTQGFSNAINNLAKRPDFPTTKAAYRAMKLLQKTDKEIKAAYHVYDKTFEQFFEKDEKGNPVVAETPTPKSMFKIKEDKIAEFDKKFEEFLATEAEIEAFPLTIEDIPQQGITPQELIMLETIMTTEASSPTLTSV